MILSRKLYSSIRLNSPRNKWHVALKMINTPARHAFRLANNDKRETCAACTVQSKKLNLNFAGVVSKNVLYKVAKPAAFKSPAVYTARVMDTKKYWKTFRRTIIGQNVSSCCLSTLQLPRTRAVRWLYIWGTEGGCDIWVFNWKQKRQLEIVPDPYACITL